MHLNNLNAPVLNVLISDIVRCWYLYIYNLLATRLRFLGTRLAATGYIGVIASISSLQRRNVLILNLFKTVRFGDFMAENDINNIFWDITQCSPLHIYRCFFLFEDGYITLFRNVLICLLDYTASLIVLISDYEIMPSSGNKMRKYVDDQGDEKVWENSVCWTFVLPCFCEEKCHMAHKLYQHQKMHSSIYYVFC